MEQRADTVLRQRTLVAAVLFAAFQMMLACSSSSSTDLLQVFTGLPTFLLPCGFHSRACLVMSDVGFRQVWPIQFHLRLAISSGTHSSPVNVRTQSSLLLIFFWPVYPQDLSQTFLNEALYLVGYGSCDSPGLRTIKEALLGVLGIRDNWQNNFGDKG